MAVIADVLGMIDTTVGTVVADTYAGISDAVAPVVGVASVLLIILVGLNIATQTIPLNTRTAVGLGVRIVLINVFLDLDNIRPIYSALVDAPARVGAGFLSALSGGAVTNLYDGLDGLYGRALDIGQAISEGGGYIAGPLAAVTLFLVAAAMAAITIIVLGAAKIMLAILLAVSPVVIACTMFKQTAPIFEAWVKLALGFAFVPLLVATMAGFTIAAGTAVAPGDLAAVETISDAISFVVVMILGAGLMALVPGFANSIAATNIGIGAIASRSAGYPGAALRTGGAMTRGSDSFVRGAVEGSAGRSVSERGSGSAKVGNYAARSVTTAVALAKKMKRG